ncbi:MAG: bifunctional pyr operon transcriptional regulator/uracil phosphoribosyltransferase PyrR [Clostridiales bacterium]|nr:bifunctional pyr operon transcriptional regulator/uracil phosphoribosyltransferase PyrR [Clostridiales bacterium]
MKIKAKIMDEQAVGRAITRISHEILERNKGTKDLAIIGIKTRGVTMAERIAVKIKEIEGVELPIGVLDITMYRDDIDRIEGNPIAENTITNADINGKVIVLVDDVIYTGRTVRAAMDAIIDYGRPGSILLAVLVDRGHKELPIRPDFVGKNVPTSRAEIVDVRFVETDGVDEVVIREEIS